MLKPPEALLPLCSDRPNVGLSQKCRSLRQLLFFGSRFRLQRKNPGSEEIWRSTSAIRTGAGPGSPCRPAYSTGLIPLKPVWHGPRAGLRRAILPNFAHGTARTLFFSIGKSLSAAQRIRGADETGLWFGIVALVASGLSLQDWRRCLEIPVERRLPRLEARKLLLKPGRSPRCGLFARCASVHVDFHAHRHFGNLRSFPGHSGLQVVNAISRMNDGKATSTIVQVFTLRLCAAHATSGISGRYLWLEDYLSSRNSACPARVFSSLASKVPSLSGFAALKRCSTTARYSSAVSVPS